MKIAIVGCGNMGMAFAKSFLKYDLVKKENLFLIEKSTYRADVLREEKSGVVVDAINAQITDCDIVILSVKPQDFASVQAGLRAFLQPQQVVLSIMAGIPIATIQERLNHQLVIRAMPNTPAMIGMGITGFSAAKELSFAQLLKIGRASCRERV